MKHLKHVSQIPTKADTTTFSLVITAITGVFEAVVTYLDSKS
jgi:hypothetical protein